jgi:hypothetical protein
LPPLYEHIASELNFHFFDSSKIVVPDAGDGIHLDEHNNHLLGKTLAKKITEVEE